MSQSPSITVKCEGELTLVRTASLHSAITAALRDNESIVIDCSGISEIDLTFVQILVSARRSAQTQQKHLEISAPEDGLLAAALARLGLSLADLSIPAVALH